MLRGLRESRYRILYQPKYDQSQGVLNIWNPNFTLYSFEVSSGTRYILQASRGLANPVLYSVAPLIEQCINSDNNSTHETLKLVQWNGTGCCKSYVLSFSLRGTLSSAFQLGRLLSSLRSSVVFPVPPGNFRDNVLMKPLPLPSTSVPIHIHPSFYHSKLCSLQYLKRCKNWTYFSGVHFITQSKIK
jgi:hypothetical protein